MNTRIGLGLLILVALGMALLFVFDPADESGSADDPPAVEESRGGLDAASMALEREGAETAARVETAEALATGHGGLLLQVIEFETRAPLADCKLSLELESKGDHEDRTRQLRSNAEGECWIELPAGEWAVNLASRPEHTDIEWEFWPDATIREGEITEIEVPLLVGARMGGQVQDEQGRSLPGVTVRASWELNGLYDQEEFGAYGEGQAQATTDELGRFRIEGPIGQYSIRAEREEWLLTRFSAGTVRSATVRDDLVLVMTRPRQVAGRILSAKGAPVAGAEIRFERPTAGFAGTVGGTERIDQARAEVVSREDGSFGPLDLLNEDYRIVAQAWGHPVCEAELEMERDWIELRFGSAHPRRELYGQVVSSEGAPVPDAELMLFGPGMFLDSIGRLTETRSGPNGEFRFGPIPIPPDRHDDGPFQLLANAKGHGLTVLDPLELDAGRDEAIEVRMHPEAPIAGQVVYADGKPVRRARIGIQSSLRISHGVCPLRYASISSREADNEGRFHIPRLWPGAFDLKAVPPNSGDHQALTTIVAPDETVRLEMRRDADKMVHITIEVFDAETHATIPNMQLFLGEENQSSLMNRNWDRRIDIYPQYPGRFAVGVVAEGYAPWFLPRQEWAAGTYAFEAPMYPSCALTVVVQDSLGRPLPGVRVHPRSSAGQSLCSVEPDFLHTPPSDLVTDAAGSASLENLPAGAVTLQIERLGGSILEYPVELPYPEGKRLEIRL